MAFFRGHVWGGVIATTIAMAVSGGILSFTNGLAAYMTIEAWPQWLALIAVGILSACFPDVDTNSYSQRLFYWLLLILDIWLIAQRAYEPAALLGLGAMLPLLGKHRGWTHTWTASILVPAVFFGIPMLIAQEFRPFLAICYGVSVSAYVSHLILDGYLRKAVKRAGRMVGTVKR